MPIRHFAINECVIALFLATGSNLAQDVAFTRAVQQAAKISGHQVNELRNPSGKPAPMPHDDRNAGLSRKVPSAGRYFRRDVGALSELRPSPISPSDAAPHAMVETVDPPGRNTSSIVLDELDAPPAGFEYHHFGGPCRDDPYKVVERVELDCAEECRSQFSCTYYDSHLMSGRPYCAYYDDQAGSCPKKECPSGLLSEVQCQTTIVYKKLPTPPPTVGPDELDKAANDLVDLANLRQREA